MVEATVGGGKASVQPDRHWPYGSGTVCGVREAWTSRPLSPDHPAKPSRQANSPNHPVLAGI
jgi:hypothetical protein